ncbi:LacI family DNA-binding transcriptional regulator [Photobacterium nomapromontoriensis]|uniref:LacI family DNA-binding transcriptional regulator n=1 Tax=Photobacterium nomapromontoriensis TaxID=2910237 RepID=UPI003D127CA8
MDTKKNNTTIVDIAKRANVTNITVSRAFNKPELVKPDTRERILSIAREMNYSPNAFAKNLKGQSSNIIGMVTDSTFNPVYAEVTKAVCRAADAKGYTVMIFDTGGSVEAESRAVSALFSYKAAGIILSVVHDNTNYNPYYIEQAKAYRIPLVLLDRDIPNQTLPGVFLNNIELGVKAGKYLVSQADNEILIVGGPKDSEITQDRVAGILGAMHDTDTRISVIYTDYKYENALPMITQALSSGLYNPQRIVGVNGLITLAAVQATRDAKLKLPQFFSIDEVPHAKTFGMAIPCIANDPSAWGKSVSELLFELIHTGEQPANSRIFINGELIA